MLHIKRFYKKLLCHIMVISIIFCSTNLSFAEGISISRGFTENESSLIEGLEFEMSILNDEEYYEPVLKENELLKLDINVKNTSEDIKNVQFFVSIQDINGNVCQIAKDECLIETGETEQLNISKMISSDENIEKADIYLWDNYGSISPYKIYTIDKTQKDYYGNIIDDAVEISNINYQIKGVINQIDENDYIRFTAPSSGKYSIGCFSVSEEMSLKGYLYDSNNNKLTSKSDSNNYKLTVNLDEGETYYLNTTSENVGEYFIKIMFSENSEDFNIIDYDIEINGYKNQIKELCQIAFDNGEYELSQEIYNKFEMVYDKDIILHELPEYLDNVDIVSSEYQDIINGYYSIKNTEFESLKQEYISILSEYSVLEESVSVMRVAENKEPKKTSEIKEHICGVSFRNEEDIENKEAENAVQSRESNTFLKVTGIGNKSFSYKAIYPISGETSNQVHLWDFNKGKTDIVEKTDSSLKTNGSHTISSLLEGGMYLVQTSWYTSATTIKSRYAWAQLEDETAEEYYEEESEHIIADIESKDVSVDKYNNFSDWLERMDLVYEALKDFTGYTPYDGEQIKIQSTREDMNNDSDVEQGGDYWKLYMGYSGNPVRFSRPFFRGFLGRLNSGDWGDTPIHELSHDFDIDEWCFDYETLADLKLCYIVDTLEDDVGSPCKIYRIDTCKYYDKNNIEKFFKTEQIESYSNTFGKNKYSSRGMTYVMLKIQNDIGWEPFSETFHDMSKELSSDEIKYIYSSENPEEIGKFNLFMTKLHENSGVDVISKLTAKEISVIEKQYGGEIEYYVAPPEDIKSDGGKANINVPAGSEAIRRFIPEESGMYDIFTTCYGGTSGKNDTVIEVYGDDYFQELLAENDNYEGSIFSKVTLELDKNQTYYIKVKHAYDDKILADLKIAKSSQQMELDEPIEKDVGDMESALFEFTPGEKGTYIFRTNPGNILTGLTGNVIIGLYEDELLTKRIVCPQYKVNEYPQFAADLEAGKTYYLLYNGYLNKAVRTRVSVVKAAEMSISDLEYNGGKGFMIGDANALTFKLNRNAADSARYYIVPALGWNGTDFYNKTGAWVEADSKTEEITIRNIEITNTTGATLYTKIRIYDKDTADKQLIWEGPISGVKTQKYAAYCKKIELSDDLCYTDELDYYKPIECNTRETFISLDKEIPAGKIVAVSCVFYKKDVEEKEVRVEDANNYIENIGIYDFEGNLAWEETELFGGWYGGTKITYFQILETGNYMLKIILKDGIESCKFSLGVYTLDYITDNERFSRYDALGDNKVLPDEENNGTRHTYVIFNAPEHLSKATQLGDNYRYISKMPVNGNANIYWEHLNEYKTTKKYGILLFNPTEEAINVTINKKSAYYSGCDENTEPEDVPLKIWEDYKNGAIITDSLTGITSTNKVLTIQKNGSEWIYLEDIKPYNGGDTLFNGIINLSVQEGKELDCYAFMFSNDVKARIESDFNLYDLHEGTENCGSYSRTKDMDGFISGTTDAPILVSKDIDLSNCENYRLLLTGLDAPYMNAGERAGLYYDGHPIWEYYYGENCVNFSVIYKLKIKNFVGGKMFLEYNKYTNPSFLAKMPGGAGLYVAAMVTGKDLKSGLLKSTTEQELEFDVSEGDSEIYLVVSGMSSMPLTVRFEEE